MSHSDTGAIWGDPDAARRAPLLLRRIIGALMIVAIVGPVCVGFVAYRQTVRAERDESLALVSAISLAPVGHLGDLLGAAGHDGFLINPDGGIAGMWLRPASSTDDEHRSWRRDVADRGRALEDRSFTSSDPDGATWWFTRVDIRGERTLLAGRPATSGLQFLSSSLLGLVVATGAMVAALMLLGVVLQRRVVQPLGTLVDATEDLRYRGRIRPESLGGLRQIGARPMELERLGNVLLDLEADTTRGARETAALLEAARALGESLEPRVVLETALEHLQALLSIDRAAILHYDTHRRTFEVAASRGHTTEWVADMLTLQASDTQPSVRSIKEGTPIQVSDTESEVVSPELRARGRRHGYRSLLAVPLTGGLDVATALVLQSTHPRSYSYDEIELSKSFASIAGAALRNAELFALTDARLTTQTSRLEAIVESVDQGIMVAGADGRVLFANAMMHRLMPGQLWASERQGGLHTDEVLAAIAPRTVGDRDLVADVASLGTGPDSWLDVEVSSGPSTSGNQSLRVAKFVVRDLRGNQIGTGQTWTDISRERELDQMKSGLLAAVSHEFRTPLALIKGYATTLLADDVEWKPEDQREFLSLVSGEADRLTDLVQRILDMRRIDAGMVALQPMPVELSVIVDTVVDSLPHEASRLLVEPVPEVTVDVDAARIVTSLRNLVENACKYSARSHPVEIRCLVNADADADVVEVLVRDHGPGVEAELRERIFDTFVRGDSGLAAEHGGVGLGLAISRGFVEAHGGRMWVDEPDDGQGAVFRFTLPCSWTGRTTEVVEGALR